VNILSSLRLKKVDLHVLFLLLLDQHNRDTYILNCSKKILNIVSIRLPPPALTHECLLWQCCSSCRMRPWPEKWQPASYLTNVLYLSQQEREML
jgi:hypothetical protein